MKIADFLATWQGSTREALAGTFGSFPPSAPVLSTTIQPGGCVLQQDEPTRQVFVLASGTCRSVIHQRDSKVHAFTEFEAIDWFGEYEVLAGLPRYIADVQAITECVFLSIAAEDYKVWMLADPHLFLQRTQSMLRTLLSQTAQGRSSLYMNSSERLQQFLVDYYDRHAKGDGLPVKVKKTHAAISEEMGFSLRTINRAINALADEGLVGLQKGKMYLSPSQYSTLRQALGLPDLDIPDRHPAK